MLALVSAMLGALAVPASAAPPPGQRSDQGWVLSTTDTSTNYKPTFVGNGYLAARVPAAGEGYASSPVVTQFELAGLYAAPGGHGEVRASLPSWTTLGFGRSGGVYGVPGAWSCAFDQLCPAMYGQISGGAFVETSHSGSIVGGYLAGLNTNNIPTVGGTDIIPIRDAPGGAATIAIRYGNGSGGPQTIHLGVNGVLEQLTVPSTGSWDTWAVLTVPVTLNAGANTLEITVAQGDTARVNVDYLALYADGVQPPTQVASATIGTTSNYQQSLDLRTGMLSTSFDWTSPDGDMTSFDYAVNANRAEGHLGTVSVQVVPHWSGTATIIDEFDGRGLNHASTTNPNVDGKTATLSQTVVTDGNLVTAALNSALRINDKTVPTEAIADPGDGSAGQSADLAVRAGQSYRITKYVGVASSVDTDRSLSAATPQRAAADTAAHAATAGYQPALARNASAWSQLWQSSISIPGDATTTAQLHASMFYLLASMRAGVTWSTSPGGLSSDGYSGHVFWDMETWMYPALLAQYPDVAVGADTYRQKLLPAAEQYAADSGVAGARFAWESALTGTEQAPAPWGTYELHVTSDVALAQWQYYQATGDTAWLRDKAWPVLKDVADYWATRATPDPAGGYDINQVMGPDEYNWPVDNSATTNAGAQASLRIATQAAGILGQPADPAWSKVADGLKIPVDTTANIHPEFDGYSGQTVKQADVTLLQYPWGVPMSSSLAQSDLDYYKQHTDPNGPSMTDAIAAIDSAALGSPGCSTVYDYMRNSVDPFLAAPFDQWYETRNGGAFTFTTGEGGYLQEFLYGFTGLRWGTDAISINPFLPPQLPGVNITGLKWHGSTFDVSVGRQTTKLTLQTGPPLPVRVANGSVAWVTPGKALQVPTRYPAAEVSLQAPPDLTAGKPSTVKATVTSCGAAPANHVAATLDTPPGWSVQPSSPVDVGDLGAGQHVDVTWQVSPAASQNQDPLTQATLTAAATYTYGSGEQGSASDKQQVYVQQSPVQAPYHTYASTSPAYFGQSGNQLGIASDGTDVWTGNDEYGAIYQQAAAGTSATATVTVDSQPATSDWAKAGIMFRDDITKARSSPGYVMLAATPGNGVALQWDSDGNGYLDSNINTGGSTSGYPMHLKLVRDGSTYTGYYSSDGSTWTKVGTATVPSATATQDVGVFNTSGRSGSIGEANFTGFSLS